MFWACCNHSARQTRTLYIRILAVLTSRSVSLMRKWLKPGRLIWPYFCSDPWSTESLNGNLTTWFVPVMVPYHEDPGAQHRDHWRAYSTCRIRYDCLNIAEHELTRCHDRLTKDYHGVSRWYDGCTMTFPFWVFGEAVTWLTVWLRLGLFVFNLKPQGTGSHRCDFQLGLLLTAYNLHNKLDQWHWQIYNKFKATKLNWLIIFLMMTVIVRFHGIILWMHANNTGSA